MGIDKSWIDYKGHMKMACYNVLFKKGGRRRFEQNGTWIHLCHGARLY